MVVESCGVQVGESQWRIKLVKKGVQEGRLVWLWWVQIVAFLCMGLTVQLFPEIHKMTSYFKNIEQTNQNLAGVFDVLDELHCPDSCISS